MPAEYLPRDDILARLRAGPDRLAKASTGIEPTRLRARPDPDAWSPVEVLAHLKACGDVWGAAIERMLAEDHPTIRAVNPRRWIEDTDYRERDFAPLLESFTAQRGVLVARLAPLPPDAWERTARITGAGPVLTLSIWRYADRMARHERPHLRQIEAAIAARWEERD